MVVFSLFSTKLSSKSSWSIRVWGMNIVFSRLWSMYQDYTCKELQEKITYWTFSEMSSSREVTQNCMIIQFQHCCAFDLYAEIFSWTWTTSVPITQLSNMVNFLVIIWRAAPSNGVIGRLDCCTSDSYKWNKFSFTQFTLASTSGIESWSDQESVLAKMRAKRNVHLWPIWPTNSC